MSFKLIETSLDRIPAELRPHYSKTDNGNYRLQASDFDAYLQPFKSAIAALSLEGALRSANVHPDHGEMLFRRLIDRVTVDTKDNCIVTGVRPGPSGSDAATSLDELVGATAKEFPFLFGSGTVGAQHASGKTLTRAELDALGPAERMEKMKAGWKVIDDVEAAIRQPRQSAKQMSRDEFDALNAGDRAQRMRDGWALVD